MRRPSTDPIYVHRAWIGLVQPDGIVVSPAALADAGLAPDPLGDGELNQLRALCGLGPEDPRNRESPKDPRFMVRNALARFFVEVLGCDGQWLHGTEDQPFPAGMHGLERVLPEFNAEQLAPTFALRNPNGDARHANRPWLCLLKEIPDGWDFDSPHGEHTEAHWVASPMAKFERLLRETDCALGVISNGRELRVIHAPAGEGSGVMAFPLELLLGTESETVLGALVMLLGRARWLDNTSDDAGSSSQDKGFLPRVLAESRRYQNNVSTQLAEQVLDALWALLRGLQDAHTASDGALLRDWLPSHPEELYGGLLGVLLRLVFLLYAEDREQLPAEDFYPANYGIRALYEKLRDDAGHHPDTMDLRHGAWARLLATFRLVHSGGGHGKVRLPAREGSLFSPNTHPFLEGRLRGSSFQRGEALEVPAIPDGVVLRVLEKLLRVDREDLSYKTLGVEELGSVYESMMGFTVETTTGRSLALKPDSVVVDLDALLRLPGKDREKSLDALAGAKVTGKSAEALRAATTVDALHDTLAKVRSARTPALVPAGALVLQPTAERRRSGSHYTPRTLTGPIVEKTLAPVLAALGDAPTHEQLLSLKVCDPAMGSGAFLVAACRLLGDRLYEAWQRDGGRGKPREVAQITPDDDERVVARRLVAQNCLYGVDKNPFAVDLARLSLWLETLAKEHPFTFLDHVLREGDSLVGVTREQVKYLRFEAIGEKEQLETLPVAVLDSLKRAQGYREKIRSLALSDDTAAKSELLRDAEEETRLLRNVGDAMVGTFFAQAKDGERKKALKALRERLLQKGGGLAEMGAVLDEARGGLTLKPFHWELEFPEVFDRGNPGFDAIVGNPPFLGGLRISELLGMGYFGFLTALFPPAGHTCDLSAYFIRHAFDLLRDQGCLGNIATNTISQGDTREGGLEPIRLAGGTIYFAIRRFVWPGNAAVVVTILCIRRGSVTGKSSLNGRNVDKITSYLFHAGSDVAPARLTGNPYYSAGSNVAGRGFVFSDDSETNSLADMKKVVESDPKYKERIFPYLGGSELNTSPSCSADRWVLYLSDLQKETDLHEWSLLEEIVRQKVKPERDRLGDNPNNIPLKRRWWAYQAHRPDLYEGLSKLDRALVIARVSRTCAFTFVKTGQIFSEKVVVFLLDKNVALAVLQSRAHEYWARFFSATLKDDLQYTASDCFETFPFPHEWANDDALESIGKAYYEHRASIMVANNQGLTTTYNRFHDPGEDDPGILRLRELHAAMDRAVLDAYGWRDLQPTCEFLLDYVDDAEEDAGSGRKAKKKPWRYRWPDEFRDEVLARLLALNAERAAEEREAAAAVAAASAKPKRASAKSKKTPEGDGGQGTLGVS